MRLRDHWFDMYTYWYPNNEYINSGRGKTRRASLVISRQSWTHQHECCQWTPGRRNSWSWGFTRDFTGLADRWSHSTSTTHCNIVGKLSLNALSNEGSVWYIQSNFKQNTKSYPPWRKGESCLNDLERIVLKWWKAHGLKVEASSGIVSHRIQRLGIQTITWSPLYLLLKKCHSELHPLILIFVVPTWLMFGTFVNLSTSHERALHSVCCFVQCTYPVAKHWRRSVSSCDASFMSDDGEEKSYTYKFIGSPRMMTTY